MSVFLNHFLQYKKNIFIIISVVFICGLVFGFYQYKNSQDIILNYMQNLFYLNSEDYFNQYTLYLIESILMIIICTYLSSSYMGFLGILMIVFLKGMQISFSFLYVFTTIITSIFIIISLIIETCIELGLIYFLSLNCIYVSLYVAYVTFYSKQQLDIKGVINYLLNFLIISLILLTISLSFRVYIIPML